MKIYVCLLIFSLQNTLCARNPFTFAYTEKVRPQKRIRTKPVAIAQARINGQPYMFVQEKNCIKCVKISK